jgi:hypothetical protein
MIAFARETTMSRLAFALLLIALVFPRTAWSAHLAGHDQLSSAASVHTHHHDHTHEHASDATQDDVTPNHSDADAGFTHDHGPSFSLAAALALPDGYDTPTSLAPADLVYERTGVLGALSHPDSLLRPPRTA